MTQPSAVIEGGLAIPAPRPYSDLPPPFGGYHPAERAGPHPVVRRPARSAKPGGPRLGLEPAFRYETPPRRIDNERFDAALAEAKRYLAKDTVRPRSSRSDYRLAASIFAGSSIALAWLLVTYSMNEGDTVKFDSTASSAVSSFFNLPKLLTKWALGDRLDAIPVADSPPSVAGAVTSGPVKPATNVDTPMAVSASRIVQMAPLPSLTPGQGRGVASLSPTARGRTAHILPRRTVQVSIPDDDVLTSAAKPPKRVRMAQLSGSHVHKRVTLSHAMHPSKRARVSEQPEWAARSTHSHRNASYESAPWLNWSGQAHGISPRVSPAASTSGDGKWNDHMTQRRITDDPNAFHVGGSGR